MYTSLSIVLSIFTLFSLIYYLNNDEKNTFTPTSSQL
jgi:hypothetical protein